MPGPDFLSPLAQKPSPDPEQLGKRLKQLEQILQNEKIKISKNPKEPFGNICVDMGAPFEWELRTSLDLRF